MERIFLISFLQRAASGKLDEEELKQVEAIFAGSIACDGGDSDQLINLAKSLQKSGLGKLPLIERALILITVADDPSCVKSPLKQARHIVAGAGESKLIFSLIAKPDFVSWARSEGIMDSWQASLWMLIYDWSEVGFGETASEIFNILETRENDLKKAIAVHPALLQDLTLLVRGRLLPIGVLRSLIATRHMFPWLDEIFLIHFRLTASSELDLFFRRYFIFVMMKSREADFMNRILPPLLADVLERSNQLAAHTDRLRELLRSTRLELIESVVMDPSSLQKSGDGSIVDQVGISNLIAEGAARQVDGVSKRTLRSIKVLLRELIWLHEFKPWAWGFNGRWSFWGIIISLIFGITGLGVSPAVFLYSIALWQVWQARFLTPERLARRKTLEINSAATFFLVLGIIANLQLTFNYAAENGDLIIGKIAMILHPMSNPNVPDRDGKTPVQIALKRGNMEIVDFFRKFEFVDSKQLLPTTQVDTSSATSHP
ncbi:MAG: hypothetical protein HQM09_10755 [Candidatus Riflebacteria bacterium]|nr:hypothetical protein [Candidatus Riflebacteria bacterium]